MIMHVDQRTRLLEAAITCLHERGYARTTTRDIVAVAGSHLPAVNYYFGSKERLLNEAIIEGLRRWAASAMAVAQDPSNQAAGKLLRRSLDRYLSTLDSDRPYVVAAAEAFAQATRSRELRDRLAAEYQELRAGVAAHAAAMVERCDEGLAGSEADALASVVIALFDGLAVQWLLDPTRVPAADQVMRALDLLTGAVADQAS